MNGDADAQTQVRLECLIHAVKSFGQGNGDNESMVERAQKSIDFVNAGLPQEKTLSEFAKAAQKTPPRDANELGDEIPF